MKASTTYLDWLKKTEGFSAKAYPDAGSPSQGFGTKQGDMSKPIDELEANRRLISRVEEAERDVAAKIKKPLSQARFETLVDMHYNLKRSSFNRFADFVNSSDDEAIANEILKYNKTEGKESDALKKRAAERYSWWKGDTSTAAPANDLMSDAAQFEKDQNPGDLMADAPAFEASSNLMADAGQFEATQAEMDRAPNPEEELASASERTIDEDELANSTARMVAEKTGMDFETARAKLDEKKPHEVLAEHAHQTTAKFFPAVTDWAKTPENYYIYRKDPTYAQKVEVAARPLNGKVRSDFEKMTSNSIIQMKRSLIHLGMATSRVGKNEALEALRGLDEERAQNQYSNPEGIRRLQATVNALDFDTDKIMNFIGAAAENPKELAIIGGESMGSTIAATGAGAAVGVAVSLAATPAAGILAGMGTRFSVGAASSFGAYMDEQLEPFTNKETGFVDYDKAFSDPARVSEWRKQASVYGGVMGLSDAIYGWATGKAGGLVMKHVGKQVAGEAVKKNLAKAAAKGALALGAEALVGGVEEAASEGTASAAARAVKGDLTADVFYKEIVPKMKEEFAFSLLPGASIGGLSMSGAGIKTIIRDRRAVAKKTMSTAQEANNANSDLVTASQLRATKNSSPVAQESPNEVGNLIDTTVEPPPIPDDNSPMQEGEVSTDGEVAAAEAEAAASVNVSPFEWFRYHELQGKDPHQILALFPPAISKGIMDGRENDSSVAIPLSTWLKATDADPGIDVIARFNNSAMNGLEANQIGEELDANPKAYMSENTDDPEAQDDLEPVDREAKGWGTIEPGPEQDFAPDEGGSIEIIEADPNDPVNLKLRPLKLVHKFRSADEQKAFQSLFSRIKKSNEGFKDEQVQVMAELELLHFRRRAARLGVSTEQLMSNVRIGKTTRTQARQAHGVFTPQSMGLRGKGYTVAFSSTASVKTLVHEFGHSWLHELWEDWPTINAIPEENLTEDQAEYKWAMEKTAELLNLPNIGELYNGDDEHMRSRHETFSQTTEHYFLEGKFEGSAVRAVMESFRKWFVEIAHLIGKTYPQWPALKITPDVERVFEAILGVSGKVEEETTPMFPEPMFNPKMLGADGKDYIDTILMARSHAQGAAYHKAWNRAVREREKLINEHSDKFSAEAEAIVNERPAIRLLNGFNEAYRLYKEGQTGDSRLSYESVLETVFGGNEELMAQFKKELPNTVINGKKKGGLDVSVLMAAHGVSDPAVIQHWLTEMGMKDDLIDQEFDRIAAEKFPVMKTDDEIHEIAQQAVNDIGKEKLLLKEFHILATKFGGTLRGAGAKLIMPAETATRATRDMFVELGSKIVLAQTAYRFSANRILADSVRHGRRAATLFKQGNIIEAFDSKYKEIIHYFGYRVALEVQKELAKVNLVGKQILKYSTAKDWLDHYDADTMKYAVKVIVAAESGYPIPEFSTEGFSDLSGITETNVQTINDKIADFERIAGEALGPNMSVAAKLAFGDLIRTIKFVARKAKAIEINGREENYGKVIGAIGTELGKVKNVVEFTDSEKLLAFSNFRRTFINVRTLFDGLYKNSEEFAKSALGSLFYNVRNAESLMNVDYGKYRDRIMGATKGLLPSKTKFQAVTAPFVTGFWSKPIMAKELGMNFNNKGELIFAMLLMGSESGAKKFLMGHKISGIDPRTGRLDESKWQNFMARMVAEGTVTQADYEFCKVVWGIFEEIHPRVKKVMRQTDNILIGKIEGRDVHTPWGVYKGGYMPISPSKDLMKPGMLELDGDGGTNYHGMYPIMNTSFTKERLDVSQPVDLDLKRLNIYLAAAMRIIHLRAPLQDFGRVIMSEPVRFALEAQRPGAIREVIEPWFMATTKQEYTDFSKLWHNRLARKLRMNVNVATYLGGFLSPVRQILGFISVVSKVSPTEVAKGVGKAGVDATVRTVSAGAVRLGILQASATPKTLRDEIMRKSTFMADRFKESQKRFAKTWDKLDAEHTWATDLKNGTEFMTFAMIQLSQNFVDTGSWIAAYNDAIDRGMSEDHAINFADDVVETTQSSPNVSSFANLQRGNDFTKLFTMVSSVPIAMHNLVQAEVMRDVNKLAKAKAVLTVGLLATVLPQMIDSIMTDSILDAVGMSPDDDEEDEDKRNERDLKKLAIQGATGSLDSVIPIVPRAVVSTLLYGSTSVSPAITKLGKHVPAAKGLYQSWNGNEMTPQEVAGLMDVMTLYTGLPLSVLGKLFILEESTAEEGEQYERELTRKFERETLKLQEKY